MAILNSLIQINIGVKSKEQKNLEKYVKSKTYNTAYGKVFIEDLNALSEKEIYHYFGPFEMGGY